MEILRYFTLILFLVCSQSENLAGSQVKSRSCLSWLAPWFPGKTNNSSKMVVDEERKISKYTQAIALDNALKKECRLVSQTTKKQAQVIMDLTGLSPELAAVVLGYVHFQGVCKAIFTGHAGAVTALYEGNRFFKQLPNNTLLSISSNPNDHNIRAWDIASKKYLGTIVIEDSHTIIPSIDMLTRAELFIKPSTAIGYNEVALPNGKVASSSVTWDSDAWRLSKRIIKICNASDGKCLQTLSGHSRWITCLIALSDGKVASGSWDNTIKIWDSASGECLHTLKGHESSVEALEVLPDGNIISGSSDNTIKIWDSITGQCLSTLTGHTGGITCLKVLPNGSVASGSQDSMIRIWE